MPICNIYVSIPKSQLPYGFILKASQFIADLIGKPEAFVCIRVCPDQMVSFGGSTDPCGIIELHSIGKLGEKNSEYTAAIGKFIEENLKISAERFYVIFDDLQRNDVGYKGKTFA